MWALASVPPEALRYTFMVKQRLIGLQAVLFDLDGTLLDRRLSFEQFMRNQWTRFAADLQSVDQTAYVRTVTELDRDGYAPRRDLFVGTLARFGLRPELAGALLEDYRARFPGACLLFPHASDTLSSLRAAELKLGLITNGSERMQLNKIQCLALGSAFDTVLISEVEGVSKPDPEIFRRALGRLATEPERAVFVGDHPDVDISGARAAGMKAMWRRDRAVSRTVEADGIIDDVADLLPWLGLERRAMRAPPAC
jgi:putative hydrolase of the HAD superfamily